MTIFERLKKVKAFAFDVDGVLTNGNILVMETGEQLRMFNTKDGYAVQLAVKHHYPMIMMTGGKSLGVKLRIEALGVKDIFINTSNKEQILNRWMKENKLIAEEVLFMGDDAPDLKALQQVGMPTCPSDAIEDVKKVCHYISQQAGGNGAVRDVIEKVMRLHGTWDQDPLIKSI